MNNLSNLFDKALHYLGQKQKEVFVINIGAMDGVLFDEMIGYSNMYNFKGLYVEPIPYLFEKLKQNLGPTNLFENSAISSYDGQIKMITIDPEPINSGLLHNCFYGMSAIYPPKNGLGSEFDKPTVDKYGKLVEVSCITFNTLITKHNVDIVDVIKIDAEGHDFQIFEQIPLSEKGLKVIRLEWINLEKYQQEAILQKFNNAGFHYEILDQDITAINPSFYKYLESHYIKPSQQISEVSVSTILEVKDKQTNSSSTLVTGLWNLKRDSLTEGWSRSYQSYLEKFEQLLQVPNNLIIYGEQELQEFVLKRRDPETTQFIVRNQSWFKNEIYDQVQKIRTNPNWFNQSGWLPESTQAKLDTYNPVVMSKMFLLNDARILSKFNSEYMYWIDAGITNSVHPGYFTHDRVIDKIHKYTNRFSFVGFPYKANTEIHGFSYPAINEYAGADVSIVARGGIFGGPTNTISEVNSIYYHLLTKTLQDGFMGTEESVFSIMLYKYPELLQYFLIEDNGLVNLFFENLKNDNLAPLLATPAQADQVTKSDDVGLYVITYNSPKQVETLISSMLEYDPNFINKPKKFLLDNSTNLDTQQEYKQLCEQFNFTHIKKDNIGICGGRQFIAEHAEEQDLDSYFFFEDDMFFYPKHGEVCRNGFNRKVENLYDTCINIVNKQGFDFLKLNYSEFFGDNGRQWSWYNVPQNAREEHFPEKTQLPITGIDEDSPRTSFKHINSVNSIPYIDGEVYYSNWPQLVSREGNKKMFLETKWAHPFEQTWMSHFFQETKKGNIKPGLLLITPTEHDRFDHYPAQERREN